MRKLTLNIPDTIELDDAEVAMFLAAKLYESGRLSLGQAADLVDMTKPAFAEILGRYGIGPFQLSCVRDRSGCEECLT